jgi:hypothetical protein
MMRGGRRRAILGLWCLRGGDDVSGRLLRRVEQSPRRGERSSLVAPYETLPVCCFVSSSSQIVPRSYVPVCVSRPFTVTVSHL